MTFNDIKSTINKHVGCQANTFQKGMSAGEQDFFDQTKQAINSRDKDYWIEKIQSIFDDAEIRLRERERPQSLTSSGFARVQQKCSIWTGKYSPRFEIPKETVFVNTKREGFASTPKPKRPKNKATQQHTSYNTNQPSSEYYPIQQVIYSAKAIKSLVPKLKVEKGQCWVIAGI